MTVTQTKEFVPGKHYSVKSRTGSKVMGNEKMGKFVRRAFLYTETRFGMIPCSVFTSRIDPTVCVVVQENSREAVITYKRPKGTYYHNINFPESTISIPHYDLIACLPLE